MSRSILEVFTVDALTISTIQLIPKRNSTNAECVLAAADITTLMMEIMGRWRWALAGIPKYHG